MAAHDALISGSFAIQFFERVNWDESDLDIFVHDERGTGTRGFEQYLCEREGYRFDRELGDDSEMYQNMSKVRQVWTARGLANQRRK